MNKSLKVGLVGLGNIGKEVAKFLIDSQNILLKNKLNITLYAVSALNKNKNRGINLTNIIWVDNPIDICSIKEINVVVELIGGESGVALELARESLSKGKNFITANKGMVSKHGAELIQLARKSNLLFAYEAAVGGGIPVIKMIQESFSANKISSVYGILNGTCNYVLTQMREKEINFIDALEEAKKLGYAEKDPKDDISGLDTAYKLSILSGLSFNYNMDIKNVFVEGIESINILDIKMATELGYKIILLGVSSLTKSGSLQRVHPTMVRNNSILSQVNGVLNTVVIKGDLIGTSMVVGEGAGPKPTTSSILSDIYDLAVENYKYINLNKNSNKKNINILNFSKRKGKFYLRIMVKDEPGVVADISSCLRSTNVSISSLIQREGLIESGKVIPLIIITHQTTENRISIALTKIHKLKNVIEKTNLIRIEEI